MLALLQEASPFEEDHHDVSYQIHYGATADRSATRRVARAQRGWKRRGSERGQTHLSGYVPSGGGSSCMDMSGISCKSLGASRFRSVGSAMVTDGGEERVWQDTSASSDRDP